MQSTVHASRRVRFSGTPSGGEAVTVSVAAGVANPLTFEHVVRKTDTLSNVTNALALQINLRSRNLRVHASGNADDLLIVGNEPAGKGWDPTVSVTIKGGDLTAEVA